MAETVFSIELEQEDDYRFRTTFDWPAAPAVAVDTSPPLGRGEGPDAERLLAAAVGYCLTASLLFATRKFKQDPGTLRTQVSGTFARNERGRLRVGGLAVKIQLGEAGEQIAHLERALAQFEDFCTVTESVRRGIAVDVQVVDASGKTLHGP